MTARRLTLTEPLAAPALGLYRNGLPRTSRAPYAAYLWGSNYGVANTADLSGNGRNLTSVGTGFVDAGTSIRHQHVNTFFTAPYDADDFANAGPQNAFTMLFFGRVQTTAILSWWQSTGLSGVTRRTDFSTGTSFDTLGVVADGTSSPTIINAGGASAWRNSVAGMYGLCGSVYNRFAFTARENQWTYPNPPNAPTGNVSGLAVGGDVVNPRLLQRSDGTALTCYMSGALIYDYVLGQDDISLAYTQMRALYASYGLAV